MSVRIVPRPKHDQYPLRAEQIRKGQFAEHENGTIVIRLQSTKTTELAANDQIINIENGVGGYSSDSRFRLIPDHTIRFEIGDDSMAEYRER